MNRFAVLFLSFFLLSYASMGQFEKKTDSLISAYNSSSDDSVKLDICGSLFFRLRDDKGKALVWLDKMKSLTQKVNTQQRWDNFYMAKATEAFLFYQNYDSSLYYDKLSIKIREQFPEPKRSKDLKQVYGYIAGLNLRVGKYRESLHWLLRADSIKIKQSDLDAYHNLNYLTVVYGLLKDRNNALHYGLKTLSFAKDVLKDQRYISTAYAEIGNILKSSGDFDNAVLYLDSSLNLISTLGTKATYELAAIRHSLADCYKLKGDTLLAILHATKVFHSVNSQGSEIVFKLTSAIILTQIYSSKGQMDSALKYAYYADTNINYQTESSENIIVYSKALTSAFTKFNNPGKAIKYFERFVQLSDSINTKNYSSAVNELLIKFEAAEKDKQIAEQTLHSNNQKLANIELQKQVELSALAAEYRIKQAAAKTSQEKKLLLLEEDLKRKQIEEQFANKSMIAKMEFTRKQELLEAENKREVAKQELALKKQKYKTYSLAGMGSLALIGIGLAYRRSRLNKKSNLILQSKNEKIETLIKELHHRVKNNMQVVSSLLSIQSGIVADSKAKEVLLEGQHRVEAMGLIHQKLYMNDDVAAVNIKEYIETLTQQLVASYQIEGAYTLQTKIDIEAAMLHIDTAIPLGLIVNELVTNALKYGLTALHPLLTVSLRYSTKNVLQLIVKDNGKGFGSNFNIVNSASMGLKLVSALTKQINGSLMSKADNGTTITIDIPNK